MKQNHHIHEKLPAKKAHYCSIDECVYKQNGICDEPRINTANGDATCNTWSNRRIMTILMKIP